MEDKKNSTRAAVKPRRTLAQSVIEMQRGNLTKLGTLTRDLIGRLEYQSDPSIQSAWSRERYHPSERFEGATRRHMRDCFQKIASLPAPFDKRLREVTEEILACRSTEYDTLPDTADLQEEQAELITECRAHLRKAALQLRETGKATVAPAVVKPQPQRTPGMWMQPWLWTWVQLPGQLEHA